jgi:DNA repair protein RadC
MGLKQKMHDFTGVETIYQKKVTTVRLKIERDYLASPDVELETVNRPYDVYAVLRAIYDTLDDDQEHVVLLVLNLAGEITGYKLISSGGQAHTLIDGKVLFRNALLLGANSIILAHNHPGGQLEPSEYDIEMTEKVIRAGKALDVEVLDHIIYTARGYTSLRETAPAIFEDDA